MTTDTCPVCNGDLAHLGSMANYNWYRCRNCGTDVGKPGEPIDLSDGYGEVEYDDDYDGMEDYADDESDHMSEYYGEET